MARKWVKDESCKKYRGSWLLFGSKNVNMHYYLYDLSYIVRLLLLMSHNVFNLYSNAYTLYHSTYRLYYEY